METADQKNPAALMFKLKGIGAEFASLLRLEAIFSGSQTGSEPLAECPANPSQMPSNMTDYGPSQ
jgi:hypothetical protein